jgi:hypothetical protein
VEYGRVDPGQHAAEERLGTLIARVLGVAAALALAALALPGANVVAWLAIGTALAIPIVRVAWLVVRWRGVRDYRFVLAALVLLVLVAAGPVIAFFS